ncbi:MAG: hypothetical protein ABSB70_22200 [Candidatus Velthaea sp.]|jgi:hypothetical protein
MQHHDRGPRSPHQLGAVAQPQTYPSLEAGAPVPPARAFVLRAIALAVVVLGIALSGRHGNGTALLRITLFPAAQVQPERQVLFVPCGSSVAGTAGSSSLDLSPAELLSRERAACGR